MNRVAVLCELPDMASPALDTGRPMRLHVAAQPMGKPGEPPSRRTDEELLALVAAGDDDRAVAELYDRFARRVFGLGVHQLGSSALAEDLVQETFVRLWQSAPRFDAKRGSAATFIFTIARRQIIDVLRRRAVRPPEGAEPHDDPAPNDIDRLLLGLAVREALQDLSPAHREVLVLAHDHRLTQSEIAARLDLPLGTVKTRTYHALRALRGALLERGVHG